MDVNAGRIADGEVSIEELGWELFHLMLEVASGRRTSSHAWTEFTGELTVPAGDRDPRGQRDLEARIALIGDEPILRGVGDLREILFGWRW